MSDALIVAILGTVLTLAVVVPYMHMHRRVERSTAEAQQRAHDYGLHEPVSIHPVIDPELCICTGNCVTVCPEHVLGILAGDEEAYRYKMEVILKQIRKKETIVFNLFLM